MPHFSKGASRRELLALASAFAAAGAFVARAQDEEEEEAILRMSDLYERDMSFTGVARDLEGERVLFKGFMAPPLKADSNFFVLTKRPMSVCPFCETSAEWPDDIMAVYTKRRLQVVAYNWPIKVRGVLKLDEFVDPETGFLSRARLEDASVSRL